MKFVQSHCKWFEQAENKQVGRKEYSSVYLYTNNGNNDNNEVDIDENNYDCNDDSL